MDMSSRILIKVVGTWDGCAAPGTLERNENKRLRDKSSARSLHLPGMCVQDNWKSCCASIKNAQRSRCIKCICLLVLELSTATTASLSQRHRTFCLCHRWPQRAPAKAIGISSFNAIGRSFTASGHWSCNHSFPYHVPQP